MYPGSFAAKAKPSNHLKTGYCLAFINAAQNLLSHNNIDSTNILRNPWQEIGELAKCKCPEAQNLQRPLLLLQRIFKKTRSLRKRQNFENFFAEDKQDRVASRIPVRAWC